MESFRVNKDGGLDMKTKINNKLVIGQAKRYKNFKELKNGLKDEINNVEKIKHVFIWNRIFRLHYGSIQIFVKFYTKIEKQESKQY